MTWVPKRHEKMTRDKLRRRFGRVAADQLEQAAKLDIFNVTVERGRLKMTAPEKVGTMTQDWLMEQIYNEKRRRGEQV